MQLRSIGMLYLLSMSCGVNAGEVVPDAAINYVWDNRYPVGTRKQNAYTDRTHMIVAESGGEM